MADKIDYKSYQNNFSEEKFNEKTTKFAKKIGLKAIYTALLLYYTVFDDKVDIASKAMIYGALGYFILPADIIPDLLPGMGFTDDIAVLSGVLTSIKTSITPEIEEKAKTKLTSIFPWYKGEPLDIL